MSVRFASLLLCSALIALPGVAPAQSTPPIARPAAPAAQMPRAPVATVPTAPRQQVQQPQVQPQAAPAPVPAPAPLPPPLWTVTDAHQLLVAIQGIGKEGLSPADYDPAGLIAGMRSGDPLLMSAAASHRFKLLASDLALGHVRGDDRQQWFIEDPDLEGDRVELLLRAAVQQHRIGEALQGLLPTHPQYAALREALAKTPAAEIDKINRIRLNMDRWRWLPRDLGERYIIVNVPAYTAALVENGETTSRHRAVAGATKTPTPQISAIATGVVLNPWWFVPKSIEKEVRGKRGYVATRNDEGDVIGWRQPPGPSNALGRVKFVMPNPEAIYLHDTNARGLFDSKARAYSHGCIRTEHIMLLAKKLLTEGEGSEWTEEKIEQALASKKSVEASFARPLPVYIVYFSSAALTDGGLIAYKDIYNRDEKVLEALLTPGRGQPKADAKAEKVAAR
jgi:murein L,D-transpeptidase YcbB/YkuD